MPDFSPAKVAVAEARADLAYSQGLWYAWGRKDSGQYSDLETRLEVFEFARRVKESKLNFELEKTYMDESIQGQWEKFVTEKTGEK